MYQVQAVIARRRFVLNRSAIERTLRSVLPEPVGDHFVVVEGRRFPPKQVISVTTGLDRADFNTHQARQVLRRLGFTVARRGERAAPAASPAGVGGRRSSAADALRPFLGQWVAQCGDEVLVAASTPQAVVAWLEHHNLRADAMFRVPVNQHEATGIGPS